MDALVVKGNPEIREREDAARTRGVAEAILKVLAARSLPVSATQREQSLGCPDSERLDLWLGRAPLASSADEVLSDPQTP